MHEKKGKGKGKGGARHQLSIVERLKEMGEKDQHRGLETQKSLEMEYALIIKKHEFKRSVTLANLEEADSLYGGGSVAGSSRGGGKKGN
jgi:hypothetical protein